MRRPDLVDRLVLISANADVARCMPEFLAAAQLLADSETYEPLRDMYATSSHDDDVISLEHTTRLYQAVRSWPPCGSSSP